MEKAYRCPICSNNTLFAVYENDDIYVCDECASEFNGVETYNGGIKFTEIKDELDEQVIVNESNSEEIISGEDAAYILKSKIINAIYGDYSREIDNEADELYREYSQSEKSPDSILTDKGYTENDEVYSKQISSAVSYIFDLSKLDDTNYITYYALYDGEIPEGWTSTKMKLTEDIEQNEEIISEDVENEKDNKLLVKKFAVQYLDPKAGWVNSETYYDEIEAQKARAKLHRETGLKTKVFAYNPENTKNSVNTIVEALNRFSESILTQNPIDKVVYGSIRVLLENGSDEKLRVVGYVSDVSFASKEVKSIDEGEEILDDIRELIVSLKGKTTGEASYYEYLSNFDRVKKYIRNKLSIVKESINPNSVSAKSFNDLVKALADRGYEVDSADKHSQNSLYDTILLYKDDQEYEATLNKYRDGSYQVILSEDLEDEELETAEQKISSANTSINSSKLPAIFNLVDFKSGSLNLDFGGGKFDNATEFLAQQDVESLVYDPYNRTAEHNKEVLKKVRENGGADTITLSNVLNVIAEPDSRLAVLRNCKKLLKSGGTLYITVYEGTGKGDSKETKVGYQLNKKTADYIEEISSVFSDVSRKGKLIIAK